MSSMNFPPGKLFVFTLLLLSFLLMGCTDQPSTITPPYSTPQFVNRSTDTNYTALVNDPLNDGKGLLWNSDLNKWDITVLQNDIDGGYAATVYLATQRTDGGGA